MDINSVSHVTEKQATSTESTTKTRSTGFSKELQQAKTKTTTLDAIFQKAADTYHVDVNLLKSMAKAESEFHNNSTSHCGAKGIMQLMPATAKYLGVKDPYDPEQNIMGGAKYISRLLKQYNGNVNLALAAYNAGSGNVKKYGGIPPFKETQNYVRKINGFMRKGVTIPKELNVVPNKSGTDYSSVNTANTNQTTTQTVGSADSNASTTQATASGQTETAAISSQATTASAVSNAPAPDNSPDNVAIVNLTDAQTLEFVRLNQEYAAMNAMELVLSKLAEAEDERNKEILAEYEMKVSLDQIAVDSLSSDSNEDLLDKLTDGTSSKEQVASQSITYNKTVLGLLTDSAV
ncbi:MAG: lytic transglycosylase domain-containing protein [Lachnospiraceae bacterium]|jgi:hypothetical protein|nr:lytic transglycosylase domain-containing protein [Lachnospiraceae bacterium]